MRADLPALPPALGRYRIDSVVGTGGTGAVHRAFDPILDRVVALKTIKPGVDDRLLTERLYREAKACGRLDHPHIVTIFDLGEIEGTVFIAMEYLEGTSLRQAIDAASNCSGLTPSKWLCRRERSRTPRCSQRWRPSRGRATCRCAT